MCLYGYECMYVNVSTTGARSSSQMMHLTMMHWEDFCGDDDFRFAYIVYPAFFSPNNDGTNDYWYIKGMSFYPNPEVTIFDRYGKVIAFINKQNPIWDGTYNGKQLPADDYWFVAKVSETLPEHKGHFSLIR